MVNIVVLGADWGDEGKGKLTDILAEKSDLVVRYHGGPNAGHTVVVGNEKFAFHHIPSGALHPNVVNIMANGMVIDLDTLVNKELAGLDVKGIKPKLSISDRADLIMPWHKAIDEIEGGKIGTTGRGIGLCYADKVARKGIKVGDLVEESGFVNKDNFYNAVKERLREKNELLVKVYGKAAISTESIMDIFIPLADKIKDYVADTSLLINEALNKNKNILFEGAHGALLDIDYGTFPYVTSSNCTVASLYSGTGTRPRLDRVIGVAKAYTTRVGHGPFPTEQGSEHELEEESREEELTEEDIRQANEIVKRENEGSHYLVGKVMRKRGSEYGTTTGSARCCGWRDLVALLHSHRLNSYTELMITKLDVLDVFESVWLCFFYKPAATSFPSRIRDLEKCAPVYLHLPGWQADTNTVRSYNDLPLYAKSYIEHISSLTGIPVTFVGVGPDREQILEKNL